MDLDPELLGQFRRACGSDGPWGLHLRLGHVEESTDSSALVRAAPFLVAGRDPTADLVLDDPAISQRHAYFQVVAGRVFIFDLASRSGLTWNDGQSPWGWLAVNSDVGLGPFRVRLGAEPAGGADGWPTQLDDPLASHPVCHDSLPGLFIEDLGQGASRRPRPVRAVVSLIGRAPSCRIRLDDVSVSRFHAAIIRTPTGPWIVDLLGRGGMKVNGRRTRLARLTSGDELGIAGFAARTRVVATADYRRAGIESETRRADVPRTEESHGMPALRPDLAEVARLGDAPAPPPEVWRAALDYMGEWFGALFREQAALIRDELAQLVRLNRELAELYGRLTSDEQRFRPPSPPVAGPAPSPLPLPDPTRPTGPAPPPGVHLELIQRIETLQHEQRSRWQRLLKLGAGKS